jgi:hypothetical protein
MQNNHVFIILSTLFIAASSIKAAEQNQPNYLQQALRQYVGQEAVDKFGQMFGGSQANTEDKNTTNENKGSLQQALSSGNSDAVRKALQSTNLDKESLIKYALMAEEDYLRTGKTSSKEIVSLIEQKLHLGTQRDSSGSLNWSTALGELGSYLGGSQQNQSDLNSQDTSLTSNQGISQVMNLLKEYEGTGSNSPEQAATQPKKTKHWYDYFTGQ